jgi:hypothetical protein
MFGNNRQSLRAPYQPLPCLPRVITIESSLPCHSEGAQRPKNPDVAQGKLPEEESLEILRFAQNDIWMLLDTLGEGGAK